MLSRICQLGSILFGSCFVVAAAIGLAAYTGNSAQAATTCTCTRFQSGSPCNPGGGACGNYNCIKPLVGAAYCPVNSVP